MELGTFFDLLKREGDGEPVRDEIIAAIHAYPGIVSDAYEANWGAAGGKERARWLWAFSVAGFTLNSRPAERPAGSVLLFRGAPESRKYSMSWTTSIDYARGYACRAGPGQQQAANIYAHWAEGAEILACVSRTKWMERGPGMAFTSGMGRYIRVHCDEYVLDWRYLNPDNVTLAAVHPTNYPQMCARYAAAGREIDFAML